MSSRNSDEEQQQRIDRATLRSPEHEVTNQQHHALQEHQHVIADIARLHLPHPGAGLGHQASDAVDDPGNNLEQPDTRQHEQAADHQGEAAAMLSLRPTIEDKAYRVSCADEAITC